MTALKTLVSDKLAKYIQNIYTESYKYCWEILKKI